MTTLLLIASLGMPPAPVADDLPSPAALFDLYRKNFDGITTLKVQWRRDLAFTEAWALDQEKELEALAAKIAAASETSADAHAERQAMVTRRQAMAANLAPKTMFQTFLTDRTRFMMRNAPPNWGALHRDDDWLMPDVPVRPETMAAKYPGFTLMVYSGDPAAGFRTWTPQPYGGGYGMVHRQIALNPTGETMSFPPLAVDRGDWGKEWHPIDRFFQQDPSKFTSVGRATIGGHETVIIESVSDVIDAPAAAAVVPTPFPGAPVRTAVAPSALRSMSYQGTQVPTGVEPMTEAEAKLHAGRVKQRSVTRAYIDPRRGGLPLKIEWDAYQLYDGKPMPRPRTPRPYRVLEVTEVVQIKGVGFYPSKGADRVYGPDPAYTGPKNTIEGLLAGKVHDVPTVPFEETTWHAAKVEANAPLNEAFALEFPDGVYYYNEITQSSEQSGWEKHDGTRLPWTLCGLIVAGWVLYGAVTLTLRLSGRSRGRAATASP